MNSPLDFTRVWLPYLYLYGVGGIVFICGLILVRKSNALDMKKSTHRMWFIILVFGFTWYMAIHGITTLAALGRYNQAVGVGVLALAAVVVVAFLLKSYRRTVLRSNK